MPYLHGVTVTEVPTSITPPVNAEAGLPVVFGTAPVNLGADQSYVNKPLLAHTYSEAVAALGYSDDWDSYTLCEFMKSHFALFNVAPVVFVNVLDPATHKTEVPAADLAVVGGVVTIAVDGILLSSVVVKLTSAGQPLVKDTDYTIAFNDDGHVVVTRIATGTIPEVTAVLNIAYSKLDPTAVDSTDIIGGVNITTGAYTGLELVNKVFPLFPPLVPGQILAPGWSHNPAVAAVMKAKAGNINGLFKAIAITDVDDTSTGADLYSEVPAWKTTNNYTDPQQIVCWPKVSLGSETYHLSTQVAGIICKTDSENDDIPYVSPSNKSLQADGAVIDGGAEVTLDPSQANYLNGQGVVTALNFIGGWRLWGNRTGAYPTNTDPKDAFIPIRRMNNWISNTTILTYWQKVDNPTNKRLIDTVVDSLNIWLNGLTARGALLGGRLEFIQAENPTTDLLNGIIRFHMYQAGPTPAENLDFILEYDTSYLSSLFA
ncbi:phage tail sheath family protein [Pelotomaculum propionicicum]|uniref:Putative prophage major tail sheath protein n=1 Tax=Pelotomaculum propionicicum TaxID=258475 RepID=A0A4Y7RWK0_9FIRM|nr:phage tail sheath family protein [Pelotomaculum propionicicum]TEB13364.1 putative prophage major tail sheath protein [Pelotomaculum propionicicum]